MSTTRKNFILLATIISGIGALLSTIGMIATSRYAKEASVSYVVIVVIFGLVGGFVILRSVPRSYTPATAVMVLYGLIVIGLSIYKIMFSQNAEIDYFVTFIINAVFLCGSILMFSIVHKSGENTISSK